MARRRILIVHDSEAGAADLAARLDRLGYDPIATAGSSPHDIAVARTAMPDLVLISATHTAAWIDGPLADAIHAHVRVPVVALGAESERARVPTNGRVQPDDHIDTACSDGELRACIELALCRADAFAAVHELEGFFSVAINLFCFLDFNGRFRRLNEAWERTLGFTREELMSQPFIEFVHPDDRERTLQQNAAVRAGGQAKGFENRYVCKDGSYRWLQWNATSHPSERVIYSVARDVTEQKQLETERAQLVAELQASLAEVKALQKILPICSYCRKIRDDEDYWQTVESYISQHTNTRFSHGICPSCLATHVDPQFRDRR